MRIIEGLCPKNIAHLICGPQTNVKPVQRQVQELEEQNRRLAARLESSVASAARIAQQMASFRRGWSAYASAHINSSCDLRGEQAASHSCGQVHTVMTPLIEERRTCLSTILLILQLQRVTLLSTAAAGILVSKRPPLHLASASRQRDNVCP